MGFVLRGFLGGAQVAGTEVAAVFDVVAPRQGRNHGGSAFDIADAAENDFGAAVVDFEGATDFDGTSGQRRTSPTSFRS